MNVTNDGLFRWAKALPGIADGTNFLSGEVAWREPGGDVLGDRDMNVTNDALFRWLKSLPGEANESTFLAGDITWKETGAMIGVGELFITPEHGDPHDILGYGTWEFLGTATLD